MKPTHLIALLSLVFVTPHLCAQTRLNPPDESNLPENFEEEFQSSEFLPVLVQQAKEPEMLGLNRNGDIEYSVLENKPVELFNGQQQRQNESTVPTDSHEDDRFEGSRELNQLLTRIVLKHLPHEYVQDKKWGQQSKRWAGVRFRRDTEDSKLETKQRYKMVNHGTWQKYSAELSDAARQFSVQLENVSQNRLGITTIDVGFIAELNLDARQSKWVKGVQLYSLSAEGNATIRLLVSCDLDIDMDLSHFPPDLVLSPVITKAKIDVRSFKLDRVSKAGGEFAQQVTRYAKKELDSEIAEKEKKLVKKLNKEINENRDKLRLSIADAVRLKWFDQAKEHLPKSIRSAIAENTATDDSAASRNAAIEPDRR